MEVIWYQISHHYSNVSFQFTCIQESAIMTVLISYAIFTDPVDVSCENWQCFFNSFSAKLTIKICLNQCLFTSCTSPCDSFLIVSNLVDIVLLETEDVQLVRKFLVFYGIWEFMPWTQGSISEPYIESEVSIPNCSTLFTSSWSFWCYHPVCS